MFLCCCHLPFFLFCFDCAVREWLLELECPCRERLLELECPCFRHLANCSRLIFMGPAVFSLCWPVFFLASYRKCTLSLQVLGRPSSVGLLVQNLAWVVWRQVINWTDEVYGSFHCCSFRYLESSAQVGCFWSALMNLDILEARL